MKWVWYKRIRTWKKKKSSTISHFLDLGPLEDRGASPPPCAPNRPGRCPNPDLGDLPRVHPSLWASALLSPTPSGFQEICVHWIRMCLPSLITSWIDHFIIKYGTFRLSDSVWLKSSFFRVSQQICGIQHHARSNNNSWCIFVVYCRGNVTGTTTNSHQIPQKPISGIRWMLNTAQPSGVDTQTGMHIVVLSV